MAFNYIEYRRESDKENTSSESPEENSVGEEEPKAETTATDASSQENRNRSNRSVEEKSAPNSTEETKQTPEHVCESCLEDFGIEKPASRKEWMSGREQWLCDRCLQAAGYPVESN